MTRSETDEVLRMLARIDRRIETLSADVALIRQEIMSHRDRLAQLEQESWTPVDCAG